MSAIMEVVEEGLRAHGRREVVLAAEIPHPPSTTATTATSTSWSAGSGPVDTAGVKVVGDYVENYRHGLPSEVAMLTLFDPRIGIPKAVMDATDITTHRTGAVTGIGARHLARKDSKVVGHLGARGTAFSNIESLMQDFDIEEVRITSKRPETREKLAEEVRTRPLAERGRLRRRRGDGARRGHRGRGDAAGAARVCSSTTRG